MLGFSCVLCYQLPLSLPSHSAEGHLLQPSFAADILVETFLTAPHSPCQTQLQVGGQAEKFCLKLKATGYVHGEPEPRGGQ